MPVSSSFFAPLRLFESWPKDTQVERLNTEQRYNAGARFTCNSSVANSSNHKNVRTTAILGIIENFNSEPLFPGNGLILFNRASRFFATGTPLAPHEAIGLLEDGAAVQLRLARVRPAQGEESGTQVHIIPLKDFSYQIESAPALISWWQTVGRNFCDGVF